MAEVVSIPVGADKMDIYVDHPQAGAPSRTPFLAPWPAIVLGAPADAK